MGRSAVELVLIRAKVHSNDSVQMGFRCGLAQYHAVGLTVPMGVLIDRLHLDSARLSPLLKRLAALGLVERRRSRVAERVLYGHCTAAGDALRDRVRAVQAEVELATELAPSELAATREDHHRLAGLLRDFAHDGGHQGPQEQIS